MFRKRSFLETPWKRRGGVYSRDGISGTGNTGRVMKVRVPGSTSRAPALNRRRGLRTIAFWRGGSK